MSDTRLRTGERPSVHNGGPTALWMIVASTWMLFALIPGGSVTWLSFGIIAAIGRRRSWWIASVVYGVAAFLLGLSSNGIGELLQGTLYLVGIAHALIANPAWLSDLWARRENGLNLMGGPRRPPRPAGSTRPRRSTAAVPPEAEELLDAPGASRSDYLAEPAETDSASSSRSRAAAPARSQPSPTPVETTEAIDVNTANQRAVAKLPGMSRRLAKTVLAERTKRGGFSSLEDFAATAGLQPHEIVRLRGAAFCSPRPRSARGFGRRVDF